MLRLAHIAVRNLLLNRRRSLLLGIAIAAVAALLILLGSVGNGVQESILRGGTTLASGHVNVGGFYKITSGRAVPILTGAAQLKKDVIDAIPEAVRVLDRMRGWGKLVGKKESIQGAFIGVNIDEEDALKDVVQVVRGDIDGLRRPYGILLFERQAERLKVDVGDQVTISSPVIRSLYNSLDLEVVAIAKDLGMISMFSSFVNKVMLQELYQLDPDTSGVIFVYLDDPEDSESVEDRLRNYLLESGHDYELLEKQAGSFHHKLHQATGDEWTGLRLDVTTWQQELEMLQWTVKVFDTVTWLLISVLIVIITVGVMNTLWISIRDRTQEIGTLRAIGMGKWKILVMFLLEAAVLSVVASAVGVGLGVGGAALLNQAEIPLSSGFQLLLMSDTLRLMVEPETIWLAMAWIPGLTTLGALFPALRAAAMQPITAIHHIR